MNKSRLETFSDGVFAIAITLLVLDISIPEVEYRDLQLALYRILPKIFSYVISFFLIGLYWIGHHLYFEKIKKVDGTFLFLNLILLLLISFLPFPTSLLGKYPGQPLPLALYGINLLSTNFVSYLALLHVVRNPHLSQEEHAHEFSTGQFRKFQQPLFMAFNLAFLVAIICSFYIPKLSYTIYILALVSGLVVYVNRMNKSLEEYKAFCKKTTRNQP